jgi:hypothetical protein
MWELYWDKEGEMCAIEEAAAVAAAAGAVVRQQTPNEADRNLPQNGTVSCKAAQLPVHFTASQYMKGCKTKMISDVT